MDPRLPGYPPVAPAEFEKRLDALSISHLEVVRHRCPASGQPFALPQVAGFNPIFGGRFWVIADTLAQRRRVGAGDQQACLSVRLRQAIRQLAAGLSNGSSPEAVSFTLLVPADDAKPIEVRQLTEGGSVSLQARELLGDQAEVVRARERRAT
jgi:hypothetical protein